MAQLRVKLDIGFSRSSLRWGFAAALLGVCAPELGSETVTLSTYYPAPSGVYAKMITTGDTWLARDGGTVRADNLLRLANLAGDPAGPGIENGSIFYDKTKNVFRGYQNGVWGDIGGGGGWTDNAASNVIYVTAPTRRVGIGATPGTLAGFPAAPLDVTGAIMSRQGGGPGGGPSCIAMSYTYIVGGVGSEPRCNPGYYATSIVGVYTKYQVGTLYAVSSGEDALGNPLPPKPTGTMWCCQCAVSPCPL